MRGGKESGESREGVGNIGSWVASLQRRRSRWEKSKVFKHVKAWSEVYFGLCLFALFPQPLSHAPPPASVVPEPLRVVNKTYFSKISAPCSHYPPVLTSRG